MSIENFAREECVRDNCPSGTDGVLDAINFLRDISFKNSDEVEIEMYIMHAASMIDQGNVFTNNYNVTNKNVFIDHVAMSKDADSAAWCKRMADYSLWPNGNRRIANVIYNWMNASLNNPVRVVQ